MVTESFSKGNGKRLALIFIAMAILMMVFQATIAAEANGVKYKRVIADGIGQNSIKTFNEKGCLVKHSFRGGFSFDCPESVISTLNVRESRIFKITDLAADKQIEADKVWANGTTGNGVNVAVLDTGMDLDHPEIADSYLGGYDYVNNDASPDDDNGHGSHVVGIITGNGVTSNAKGVAPGAKIYMYKVCDASGSCLEDDMIAAMEASMTTDAKVMSISIGGGSFTTANCDSDPLAAEVNKVVSSGITVVVAAGNDGKGVSTPGCASGAIAVGAVNSSSSVAYFSGRGPALDIVAPGVSIYSSYKNGGYATMSGTSMATPHVAGVVALLLEANNTLTTSQIKDALYTTTNAVSSCYTCVWSGSTCLTKTTTTCTTQITGAGIVDAYKAYLKVKPAPAQPQCTVDGDCSSLSNLCNTGVCNTSSGRCVSQPKTDGTSCSDGLYCNGAETCQSGTCVSGTTVSCSSLSDQCNTGVCDETQDRCIAQPKTDGTSCNDGLYCNTGESCHAGVCNGGSALICNDGISCTTDACNENTDTCDYTWPACGIADGCCSPTCNSTTDTDCSSTVKCWSASNKYLYMSGSQANKFCKCVMGTYSYKSYSYSLSKTNVYGYTSTSNNSIWTVQSSRYYPITQVKCSDGKYYATNKDYFR